MHEQPGCVACFSYHDAFGSTKISADLRDIWRDWQAHVITKHPDFVTHKPRAEELVQVLHVSTVETPLNTGDRLYVIR